MGNQQPRQGRRWGRQRLTLRSTYQKLCTCLPICGAVRQAEFDGFLRVFGKPAPSSKERYVRLVRQLEGSMKRIGVLPEFRVWMIEHVGERNRDLVEKVIPNTIKTRCVRIQQSESIIWIYMYVAR